MLVFRAAAPGEPPMSPRLLLGELALSPTATIDEVAHLVATELMPPDDGAGAAAPDKLLHGRPALGLPRPIADQSQLVADVFHAFGDYVIVVNRPHVF